MTSTMRKAMIVARRDFMAVVATPTFFIFLLAPLLMLALGVASGTGAAYVATSSMEDSKVEIAAIATPEAGARLTKADAVLRALYRKGEAPPPLTIITPQGPVDQQAKDLLNRTDRSTTALLFGPSEAPHILHRPESDRHAKYLAALAENVERTRKAGISPDASLTKPIISALEATKTNKSETKQSGFGAVIIIFMLTLMLASQAVGMLAEEKSNKVIEILAAAVPLEAVFLGKLIGMFGVAVVFISFWGTLAGLALAFVPAGLLTFAPATGLVPFMILSAIYFTMAFMLLGAVFLGVGAQAATMREIQMMSLPITLFQMAMFGLASAAAGKPGSTVATTAEIFPFSSPFAMAARAASDSAIWPHLLAIAWQILWVALTIWVAVRLFRAGVLKSGGGWRGLFGRSTPKRQTVS